MRGVCKLNGKLVDCLIDTGSSRSFVNTNIFSSTEVNQLKLCTETAVTASGQPLPIRGETTCDIDFGSTTQPLDVLAVDNLSEPFILGLDFLFTNESTNANVRRIFRRAPRNKVATQR